MLREAGLDMARDEDWVLPAAGRGSTQNKGRTGNIHRMSCPTARCANRRGVEARVCVDELVSLGLPMFF